MLKMSTIHRNARVQMLVKVVDSFLDRCLWQVIWLKLAYVASEVRWMYLEKERTVALQL